MSRVANSQSGFTIVEVLVAVILASVIFIGLFSSLSTIFGVSEGSTQRARASALAYDNLRRYANGSNPLWYRCNTADETAEVTLLDETGPIDGLPGDTTETVTAQSPYGCDGNARGFPIKVVSRVEVANGIEVSHATYTKF